MDIASTTTTWFTGPATAQSGSAGSAVQTGASTASSALTERQMKDLIASQEMAKQLPDRKTTERQARLEKIQRLRDRLKLLRQMMAFLSPKSMKSLAAEIKQIASQLATLGDGGGGGGLPSGAGSETAGSTQGGVQQDASSSQTASAAPAEATTGTDTGAADGSDTTNPVTPSTANVSAATPNQADNSGDRQLKETVEEAKRLLRSVIEAFKRKQAQDKAVHPTPRGAALSGYSGSGIAGNSDISFTV